MNDFKSSSTWVETYVFHNTLNTFNLKFTLYSTLKVSFFSFECVCACVIDNLIGDFTAISLFFGAFFAMQINIM